MRVLFSVLALTGFIKCFKQDIGINVGKIFNDSTAETYEKLVPLGF